jgi:hypothetical protein
MGCIPRILHTANRWITPIALTSSADSADAVIKAAQIMFTWP